jgi:polyhydroxyalkanoate synthesis regulator protein
MFERAFQMFTPRDTSEARPQDDASASGGGSDDKLDDLRSQIEKLRRQLDEMSR